MEKISSDNWNSTVVTPETVIDKRCPSPGEGVADIHDGATVMIGGFGASGSPIELIHALIDHGARNLTVINNNTGNGEVGLAVIAGTATTIIVFAPIIFGIETDITIFLTHVAITIIVALVLVVSAGLMRSGAVGLITRTLVDSARSLGSHIAIIGSIGAVLSAFMNNVAALALLMPVDIQTARKAGRSPARVSTVVDGLTPSSMSSSSVSPLTSTST